MSIAEWEKMIINLKLDLGLEGVEAKDFQLYATIFYNQVWMTRNKVRMELIKNNPEELWSKLIKLLRNTGKVGEISPKKNPKRPILDSPTLDLDKSLILML